VPARSLLAAAFVSLLAGAGAAEPPEASLAPEAERSFAHTVGTLGYVWGAPLLESAIAEYRQTQGIATDLAAKHGLFAHAMGGGLATHETVSLAAPEPDILLSSAWLDVGAEPYVLFVPPMDGRWWSLQLVGPFGGVDGALSSRIVGSVGGWHLVAHSSWQGERPPSLMEDELRSDAPVTRLLLRIAATPEAAAAVHEAQQARFALIPLAVYARNPKAAGFAKAQAQLPAHPALRATNEMRGALDAFRILHHQLRRLEAKPGDRALLALFDRAGFGPGVEAFDVARLPGPVAEGLRSAAKSAARSLREARTETRGWARWPLVSGGDDPLARAVAALESGAPSLPDELVAFAASTDADGRVLDGRNDYRIRFRADALPPADAFWSLAAYDPNTRRLLDVGAERASLASLDGRLRPDGDGPLELRLSSEPPEDAALHARWLPIRPGPFRLIVRLYQPQPAALESGWSPPPIRPADD
jgi:hypothetical protein